MWFAALGVALSLAAMSCVSNPTPHPGQSGEGAGLVGDRTGATGGSLGEGSGDEGNGTAAPQAGAEEGSWEADASLEHELDAGAADAEANDALDTAGPVTDDAAGD